MFKDNGDWGSYAGDVDESGNQGNGKMTYVNGEIYEGGFVDNKSTVTGVYTDGLTARSMRVGGWTEIDRVSVYIVWQMALKIIPYTKRVRQRGAAWNGALIAKLH